MPMKKSPLQPSAESMPREGKEPGKVVTEQQGAALINDKQLSNGSSQNENTASYIPPRPNRNSRGSLSLEELGRWEINRILKNSSQAANSPRMTMFGVSPPVRGGQFGGAANPLIHDARWLSCARKVTHSNLQALRERDLKASGTPFFEQHFQSECLGDSKLLFGSMDGSSPYGAGDQLDETDLVITVEDEGCGGAPFSCTARYFD